MTSLSPDFVRALASRLDVSAVSDAAVGVLAPHVEVRLREIIQAGHLITALTHHSSINTSGWCTTEVHKVKLVWLACRMHQNLPGMRSAFESLAMM